MDEVKKLSIANFNITYGPDNDPMLTHFQDILYPAFCNEQKVRTSKNVSYFSDVELKLINSEYVLTGNLIRETYYRVRTIVVDNELVPSPSSVPTAPYSRFIIYLKSHRMILIKNEGHSPNLKSFQAVLRKVVDRYTREANRERDKTGLPQLPNALINIVNMPLPDSIDETINEFAKIKSINLRFLVLNNDIDPGPILACVRSAMNSVDSKTGNLTFNSPKSAKGISDLFQDSIASGVASATVTGEKSDGTKVKITDNQLGSELQIPSTGNLSGDDDKRIADYCMKRNYLPEASEDNAAFYYKALNILELLVNKI
ncbi:hypothetical protein DW943_00600 [Collinsella sp. AM44-11]|uniref:hypothetical protein n=1 Tax=Collinsella sp. AM44-11 TaxID=2292323 RepID=UPI000E4BA3A0|nr:hypothetical protein [Collinsella sp. AM44-11]RHA22844.1 hypothetical protein DW943_00600 [Collinsella sp. AM44-11]